MSNKKKLIYMDHEVTTKEYDNGEIYERETKDHFTTRIETEPNYIKLYLDHLNAFAHISSKLSPILMELLKYVTYANDENGGMMLYLQSTIKKQITEKCQISMTRLDHALMEFCKAGYMKRVERGTYQFNPYFFGKGEWKDIREIRATYNYNTGEIKTKFIKKKKNRKLCNMSNSNVENERGGEKFPEIGEN